MVSINTQWPGHSAEEVERLITVPIEREMNGIPKENNLRSVSLYALSSVDITFDQDTDRNFARQQVFNRLADLDLPSGVTPDVEPLTSPSGLIYRYTLQSPDRSPTELKTFEDWTVEPQFRAVSGVADDSGFGGGTMQYQVLLDQYRLAGAGLSPQQVESALGANNGNGGGGFYSEGGQFYYVRGLGRLRSLDDIGNVVVAVHDGIPTLVKDVGQVTLGIAPRLGQFGIGKQNDAVEGVIMLRTGEKTQDVLKGVEAKTQELNTSILPKDVKVVPFYDRSDLVHETVLTVENNLLRGMLLVVVILIFFLYDVRSGLIVAVTIPLSLLFAFACLDLQGASANLLSIGAIDFGILVDAAVIMVENIYRRLAESEDSAGRADGHHPRRRGRGRPAAVLFGRGHRRQLPADLRPHRPVGRAVQADGRHDDLRADRLADRHADLASGALLLADAQRRARAAQRDLRAHPLVLHARPRPLPRPAARNGRCVGRRCCSPRC